MNYRLLFFVFLFCTTIIRLLFSNLFPLAMDEGYYWDWSRNLSLSYFDHPPAVAYVIFITTYLLGTSEFSVRLGIVLLGSGSIYWIYRLGLEMFGSVRVGFFCGLLLSIIPIFVIGGTIVTPDSPQAFFWILSLYLFYKACKEEKRSLWVAAGISSGFCFLSKYTGFLLIPSMGLFLLLSSSHRRWIWKPDPYLSLVAAVVVFSPVIIWNEQHEWISFAFQASHGFAGKSGIDLRDIPEFLGAQAGLISPFLFLGILASFIAAGNLGIKKQDNNYLYLFCVSAPIFLFFTLLSAKSKIEGNWPSVCYFGGIIAMAGFYNHFSNLGGKGRWLKYGMFFSISFAFLMTGGIHFLTVKPYYGLPKMIDKLEEINLGWEELGEEVSGVIQGMPGGLKKTFVFTSRHQLVAELAFYVKGRPKAYKIGGKVRYDYKANPPRLFGMNGVYVNENQDEPEYQRVKQYFTSCELAKEYGFTKQGKVIKVYRIYKCHNYKGGLIEI